MCVCVCVCVAWFVWVLWYIKAFILFNAKSCLYKYQIYMICKKIVNR